MDKTKYLASYMLAALIVTLGFFLVSANKDLGQYLLYLSAMLPLVVGTLFTSKQNDNLADDLKVVKGRVNGALDQRFADLHAKLDDAAATREEVKDALTATEPESPLPAPGNVNDDGSPRV